MLSARIITQDLASPKLRAMLAQLAPAARQAMLTRLGKALENQLKAHFVAIPDAHEVGISFHGILECCI